MGQVLPPFLATQLKGAEGRQGSAGRLAARLGRGSWAVSWGPWRSGSEGREGLGHGVGAVLYGSALERAAGTGFPAYRPRVAAEATSGRAQHRSATACVNTF